MGELFQPTHLLFLLLPFLFLTTVITFAAVRGTRKKYVMAATLVLESFSLNPDAESGKPVIHIFGRHKGLINWILTNMGLSSRVELTVTDKEWTIREASLAGMSLLCIPLKRVRATICGYQRSVLAFAFAVLFALIAAWFLLSALLTYLVAGHQSEAGWESTASQSSTSLYIAFAMLVACGIAMIIYYASKRVALGVEAGDIRGIVFKRSWINGTAVDLDDAENATALLNRLVAAAVYDLPIAQIPLQSTPKFPAPAQSKVLVWIAAGTYVGLIVLAAILSWYGHVQFWQPFRCNCLPTTLPRRAVATSTSRAIWPKASRLNDRFPPAVFGCTKFRVRGII